MRTGTKQTIERGRWPLRAVSDDRGVSLVEVIVSIALTGGVVVAIMGALFTVVRSASQNDDAVKLQAVIGGAADQLVAVEWRDCADGSAGYLGAAQLAANRVGWPDTTVDVVEVDFWSAAADGWVDNCSGAATPGSVDALQRITIEVRSPDLGVSKSFDVVKSDTRAFEAAGG